MESQNPDTANLTPGVDTQLLLPPPSILLLSFQRSEHWEVVGLREPGSRDELLLLAATLASLHRTTRQEMGPSKSDRDGSDGMVMPEAISLLSPAEGLPLLPFGDWSQ
jgi:hypothetical protein